MFGAEPHVGVGGQMEDALAAAHGFGEQGLIEQIAPNKLEAGGGYRSFQKGHSTGGKVIVDCYRVPVA